MKKEKNTTAIGRIMFGRLKYMAGNTGLLKSITCLKTIFIIFAYVNFLVHIEIHSIKKEML